MIRHATVKDVEAMALIESASYPQAEGASKESIKKRVETFPNHFWILEENGKIVAFVNGCVTDERDLTDEMYDKPEMHDEMGTWQMIFSVVTSPDDRKRGYASEVMKRVIEDERAAGRCGIVLTCKEKLKEFYKKFGFEDEGKSESVHGDAVWYQMRLTF